MHEAVRGQRARQIVTIAGIAGAILLFTGFMAASDAEFLRKNNRSIDIFGRVYKEVTANYVDDIDPEKFMQAGVDGMLGTLDPYTVYIDKENSDEVDLLTSGKYGGVGVTIGIRDGAVRVISVMDGYSAQRQGMLPGDRFLTIGGVNVNNLKPDEIRNLTRGEPGTEVKVSVEREGEAHPLEYVLIREEIRALDRVPGVQLETVSLFGPHDRRRPAFSANRVGAHQLDFAHEGDIHRPLGPAAEFNGRPEAREARAQDQHIMRDRGSHSRIPSFRWRGESPRKRRR